MNRETIRSFNGKILGTVDTDIQGNQTVKNFYGYIVATYNKQQNITRDFYGRVLSSGNTAISQLYKT